VWARFSARLIDDWLATARFPGGVVLGAVNKGDRITGQGMSAQSIYGICQNSVSDYVGEFRVGITMGFRLVHTATQN
jgi:hypothetical protein